MNMLFLDTYIFTLFIYRISLHRKSYILLLFIGQLSQEASPHDDLGRFSKERKSYDVPIVQTPAADVNLT